MKVVDRWTVAKTMYENFKETYLDTGRATVKAHRIGEALRELGVRPNPDEVDKILASVQRDACAQFIPLCSSCGDNPLKVIVFEKPEAVALCLKCILNAFQLLEES